MGHALPAAVAALPVLIALVAHQLLPPDPHFDGLQLPREYVLVSPRVVTPEGVRPAAGDCLSMSRPGRSSWQAPAALTGRLGRLQCRCRGTSYTGCGH